MFFYTVLFCLCYVALTPYSASAMTAEQKEKIHNHFTQLGMECIKDIPISEEDITNLRNKKMATGENGPCFVACLMKKIGVMDEHGMLQKESALELAKKVFDDEEELKNIADYLHSCAHVNAEAVSDGEKGCDRASKAFQCMTDNASKFGFDV